MIDAKQLRDLVIEPVLHSMGMHSEAAVRLVLMTGAVESDLYTYIAQTSGGPGVGMYQAEPPTVRDVVIRYLGRRQDLRGDFERSFQLINSHALDWENIDMGQLMLKLATDLRFSTAVCRIDYMMEPEALPDPDDIQGLAGYHKRFYNTGLGAATIANTMDKYERLVVARGGLS